MANEQNKETQNTTTDGTVSQTTASQPITASAALPKTAKDDFSTSGSKPNERESSGNLTADSVKDTAKGFYDQAKTTAGQAYGLATDKAATTLDEKKTELASGLTSVADTIRQVGDTLRQTDEQTGITDTAAKYSNSLAQQVEQLSGYFEHKDMRDMVRDVETFARRNPAVFIGGAFVLGILAARFLKSSSPSSPKHRSGKADLSGGNIQKLNAKNADSKPETINFGSKSADKSSPSSGNISNDITSNPS